MRKISYLVIHHAAVSSTITKKNLLNSFNNTHKERLYKLYKQPISYKSPYPHIAYHFIIFRDGELYRVREEDIVGYHASNLTANILGLGICLAFDLNKEKLTDDALKTLGEIIKELKRKYELMDNNVWFHRDFCRTDNNYLKNLTDPKEYFFTKNCPGENLTRNIIETIIKDSDIPHELKEKEHIKTPFDIPNYYDIEKRGLKLYGFKK